MHDLQPQLNAQVARMWATLAPHGVTPQLLPLQFEFGETGRNIGVLRGRRNCPAGSPDVIVISDRFEQILRGQGLPPENTGQVILDTLMHEIAHLMLWTAMDEAMHSFCEEFFSVPWKEDPASENDAEQEDEEERVCEALGLHLSGTHPRAHPWPETLLQTFMDEWTEVQALFST